MAKAVKIAIAGEGGQGVQAIGEILAGAANQLGYAALYIPNFGIEQRGGVSMAFVQIADEQIGSPKFASGDIVIALSERAVERSKRYVDGNTLFVYDSSLIAPPEVDDEVIGLQTYDTVAPEAMADSDSEQPKIKKAELPLHAGKIIGIPATDTAQKELHPRVFNMVILGAVVEAAGILDPQAIKQALESRLGGKFEQNPDLRDLNYRALQRGAELVAESKGEGGQIP